MSVAVSPVLAADLPPVAPPRAPAVYIPPPPPFTWTGFYIGINGGYGWGNVDTTDPAGDTFSFSPKGGIVGGTVGFNYQWNWFVGGFEGDLDWSGMQWNETVTSTEFAVGAPITGTNSLNYKNELLSTFAARFGVAADHALFYGKAGGAWTNEKYTLSGTDVFPAPIGAVAISGSNTFDRLGWMAGVGFEYAVTNHLTLKAEYNYIDFGTQTNTLSATVGGVPASVGFDDKLTMNVIKVGINWLFNGSP
jgi:outer membrane immunogenic protein